jgi:hypothetical protein
MKKPTKDKTAQSAIVCLYLRKRRARRYRDQFIEKIAGTNVTASEELNLAALRAAECEAHNALESMKRVLWQHDYA